MNLKLEQECKIGGDNEAPKLDKAWEDLSASISSSMQTGDFRPTANTASKHLPELSTIDTNTALAPASSSPATAEIMSPAAQVKPAESLPVPIPSEPEPLTTAIKPSTVDSFKLPSAVDSRPGTIDIKPGTLIDDASARIQPYDGDREPGDHLRRYPIDGEIPGSYDFHQGRSNSYERKMGFVTPYERSEALRRLDLQLEHWMQPAERSMLRSMEAHILKGDLRGLQRDISRIPEELRERLIDRLNQQFERAGSGIHIRLNDDDKIYIQKDGSKHAIEIDTKDHNHARVVNVDTTYDGTQLSDPRSVINRRAGEVLKDIGDTAVCNINQGRHSWARPIDEYSPYIVGGMDPRPILPGFYGRPYYPEAPTPPVAYPYNRPWEDPRCPDYPSLPNVIKGSNQPWIKSPVDCWPPVYLRNPNYFGPHGSLDLRIPGINRHLYLELGSGRAHRN